MTWQGLQPCPNPNRLQSRYVLAKAGGLFRSHPFGVTCAIKRLHRENVDIIALPEIQERLSAIGLDPVSSRPEEFTTQMKIEMKKLAKVIQAANAKAE